MTEINLSYYLNEVIPKMNQNPKEFFEWQVAIKEDFKRFQYMIENIPNSKEKECLIHQCNRVIKNIVQNQLIEEPAMELNIHIDDNYLVFSYYEFDEEQFVFETPSIVIVTRDWKKLYFINEIFSIFDSNDLKELYADDTYNKGYDSATYYEISDHNVKEYETTFNKETWKLFDMSFKSTNSFTKIIEHNCKQNK